MRGTFYGLIDEDEKRKEGAKKTRIHRHAARIHRHARFSFHVVSCVGRSALLPLLLPPYKRSSGVPPHFVGSNKESFICRPRAEPARSSGRCLLASRLSLSENRECFTRNHGSTASEALNGEPLAGLQKQRAFCGLLLPHRVCARVVLVFCSPLARGGNGRVIPPSLQLLLVLLL